MSLGPRITLSTATTAASTGSQFEVAETAFVTLTCYPDLSGATVTVNILAGSSGSSEFSSYTDGTATVQLTSAQNAVRLYGPAQYRTTKSASTTATAVYLQR